MIRLKILSILILICLLNSFAFSGDILLKDITITTNTTINSDGKIILENVTINNNAVITLNAGTTVGIDNSSSIAVGVDLTVYTNVSIVDTDSDGMADSWETANSVVYATTDLDDDGYTNLIEYRYGTDPNSASSTPSYLGVSQDFVNNAPISDAQSIVVDDNISKAITLTGNDIDNDTITYSIVASPTNGSLSGSGENITYTPDTDYVGLDSFTFKVNDGTDDSNVSTISLDVKFMNVLFNATPSTLNNFKKVTLSTDGLNTSNLTYYYTTDGATPTTSSSQLTGATPDYTFVKTETMKVFTTDGTLTTGVYQLAMIINDLSITRIAENVTTINSSNESVYPSGSVTGGVLDSINQTYYGTGADSFDGSQSKTRMNVVDFKIDNIVELGTLKLLIDDTEIGSYSITTQISSYTFIDVDISSYSGEIVVTSFLETTEVIADSSLKNEKAQNLNILRSNGINITNTIDETHSEAVLTLDSELVNNCQANSDVSFPDSEAKLVFGVATTSTASSFYTIDNGALTITGIASGATSYPDFTLTDKVEGQSVQGFLIDEFGNYKFQYDITYEVPDTVDTSETFLTDAWIDIIVSGEGDAGAAKIFNIPTIKQTLSGSPGNPLTVYYAVADSNDLSLSVSSVIHYEFAAAYSGGVLGPFAPVPNGTIDTVTYYANDGYGTLNWETKSLDINCNPDYLDGFANKHKALASFTTVVSGEVTKLIDNSVDFTPCLTLDTITSNKELGFKTDTLTVINGIVSYGFEDNNLTSSTSVKWFDESLISPTPKEISGGYERRLKPFKETTISFSGEINKETCVDPCAEGSPSETEGGVIVNDTMEIDPGGIEASGVWSSCGVKIDLDANTGYAHIYDNYGGGNCVNDQNPPAEEDKEIKIEIIIPKGFMYDPEEINSLGFTSIGLTLTKFIYGEYSNENKIISFGLFPLDGEGKVDNKAIKVTVIANNLPYVTNSKVFNIKFNSELCACSISKPGTKLEIDLLSQGTITKVHNGGNEVTNKSNVVKLSTHLDGQNRIGDDKVTSTTVDNYGRVTQAVFLDSTTETYVYDDVLNQVTKTNRDTTFDVIAYDDINYENIFSTVPKIKKDSEGRVTDVYYKDGATEIYVYDDTARTIHETTKAGSVVIHTFDSTYKLAIKKEMPARNMYYEYEYNANSDLKKVKRYVDSVLQDTTEYTFDGNGDPSGTIFDDSSTLGISYVFLGGGDFDTIATTDKLSNVATRSYSSESVGSPTKEISIVKIDAFEDRATQTSYYYDSYYHSYITSLVSTSEPVIRLIKSAVNYLSDPDKTTYENMAGDYVYNTSSRTFVMINGAGTYTLYYDNPTSAYVMTGPSVSVTVESDDISNGGTVYPATGSTNVSALSITPMYKYLGNFISMVEHYEKESGVPVLKYKTTNEYNSSSLVSSESILDKLDVLRSKTIYSSRGDVASEEYVSNGTNMNPTYSYTYDSDERMLTSVEPDGATTTYTYNIANGSVHDNLPLTMETPLGAKEYYQYDSHGRQILIYGDTNQPGVTTYNDNGDILTFTLKRWDSGTESFGTTRYTETFVYKGTEVGTKSVSNASATKITTENWTYDNLERLDTHTDITGLVTKYEYDSLDRVIKTTRDFGTGKLNIESTTQYNLTGQATATINAGLVNGSVFDSLGRITQSVQDPNNFAITTTYEYDEQDRQTKVTDHRGNETTFEYDDFGNQTKVTGPRGVVTTSEYDAINQLVKQTYDVGAGKRNLVTLYVYDNQGRQTSVTQNDGETFELTTTSEYFVGGNLKSTTFDSVGKDLKTTFTYDIYGQQLTVRPDALDTSVDKTTSSTYTEYGELESSTDVKGIVTDYEYDYLGRQDKTIFDSIGLDVSSETIYKTNGLVDKSINSRGIETTIQYDSINRQIGTTFNATGANLFTSQSYNDKNQVTSSTSQTGVVTSFDYDTLGRRIEITVDATGDNRVTTLTFDATGDLAQVNDPDSNDSYRSFNVYGDLVSTTNAKSHVTTFEYDTYGAQTKITDNNSKDTVTVYDDRGLVTSQTQDNGGLALVTSFVYDDYGRVTETTDPEGKKVATTYNIFDQVLTTTDDSGGGGLAVVTTNTYDTLTQQLKTIKDDANNTTTYAYDTYFRLTSETFADTKVKSYTYNAYSQRKTITDQRTNVTIFTYDNYGRLQKTDISKGSGVNGVTQMNYTYDAQFRLKTADSVGGNVASLITRNYDWFNRLTSEDQKIGTVTKTVSKTFDTVGRLKTVVYPTNRDLTYSYDNTHQVTSIADTNTPFTKHATYSYNDRNLVASKTLASGQVLTKNYDAVYRTSKQEWKDTGTTVAGFDYKYDKVGNREVEIGLHSTSKSGVYTYDTTYKVTNFDRGVLDGPQTSIPTPLYNQSWTQDTLGNWTTFNNNGSGRSKTFDAMNQISSNSFTHDLTGNMTSDGTSSFEYDAMNRMIKATIGGTPSVYTYDAFNRRVQTDVGTSSVITNYIHDGNRVVEEQNASGTLVKDFIFGAMYIDEVIAMDIGASDYYCMEDYRFSVVALSNAGGTILERYEYSVFGERTIMDASYNVITTGLVGCDYGFTGRYHDADTGLMYFRARYYSGALGRFLSRDPLGFVDGMGLHRGYFGVSGIDPSGLATIYVHGVGASSAGLSDFTDKALKAILPEKGCVTQLTFYMSWSFHTAKGKKDNAVTNASDNIGVRPPTGTWKSGLNTSGMSSQQWMGVDKLKKMVKKLKAIIKNDKNLKGEKINIIAHSQGTLITLAALQEGMKVNDVVFMGSPMDLDADNLREPGNNTDILAGLSNADSITNLWSPQDRIAAGKGGIGGFGMPDVFKNTANLNRGLNDIALPNVTHAGTTSGWWSANWLKNAASLLRSKPALYNVLYRKDPYKYANKDTIVDVQKLKFFSKVNLVRPR